MAFIPSQHLWSEIRGAHGRVSFIHEDVTQKINVIAKLPTYVIKSIIKGSPISLMVSVISEKQTRVICLACLIDDIPEEPLVTNQVIVNSNEQHLLKEFLACSSIRLHYFDEQSRHTLSALYSLPQSEREATLADLTNTKPHYSEDSIDVLDSALDRFKKNLRAIHFGHPTNNGSINHRISFSTIAVDEPTKIIVIGNGNLQEIPTFRIDDMDEGKSQEQSIQGCLESVFSESVFRGPRIGQGKSQRELTDLIAIGPMTMCLIESKAMSIFNKASVHSSDKRSKSVYKQIEKGIKQLTGAIRNLEAGQKISSSKGEKIAIPDRGSCSIQAIVLISEMNPNIDWENVANKLLQSVNSPTVCFHVLDLAELELLTLKTQSDPVAFNLHLWRRWELMIEKGTALIKGTLDPNEVNV